MKPPLRAPYGRWRCPLDLAALFRRPSPPVFPERHRGVLYWLQSRAGEGGRMVLMSARDGGPAACITPAGYNIRSRVHEYGGRCFVLVGDEVIFSNHADQRLYRQRLDPAAVPHALSAVTGADGLLTMYADPVVTPDGRWLICVAEMEVAGGENRNRLVVLPLDSGREVPVTAHCLVDGSDFVASPVVAPDGGRLAWLEWSHPDMPWDAAAVHSAALVEQGGRLRLAGGRRVAGGAGAAACQPGYGPHGALIFALDRAGGAGTDDWWNLYIERDGVVRQLTHTEAEYGAPHWNFGNRRYVAAESVIVAARRVRAGDELVAVSLVNGGERLITNKYNGLSCFSVATSEHPCQVLFTAASATREPAIIEYAPASGSLRPLTATPAPLDDADISIAEPICFETADGGAAHAYLYRPRNTAFEAPPDTRPPLLVMVHGGPTSHASPAFDVMRQYWTTLGFAVLDVNHRGSTGYGRRYRDALRGGWGELDVADVAAAVRYVAARGWADSAQVFIRGGSAGGYTVLGALTRYPELFRAGACYYGIGNLVTLAETTHKFEARYTDTLVGERFDPYRAREQQSRYWQRSPIHFLDRIKAPMILFQGLDDRVVPPAVAREIVAALKRNAVHHEYIEYAGEGHGFRGAGTRADALRRETAFFVALLGGPH